MPAPIECLSEHRRGPIVTKHLKISIIHPLNRYIASEALLRAIGPRQCSTKHSARCRITIFLTLRMCIQMLAI